MSKSDITTTNSNGNNVILLPVGADMMGECSDWMAKVDRGLTDDEKSAFQQWLAGDKNNPAAFFEMAALWDKMDSLSRLTDLFPEPVKHTQSSRIAPLAIAASLMIAVLAGLWGALDLSVPGGSEPPTLAQSIDAKVFETAIGEHSTINLRDGSVLTLNTNSLIRTDFSTSDRALYLERGEVHVQVAHDADRPFNVFIKDKVVQAVGTEFNLEITSDQRIELIVTEGKVLVGVFDLDLEVPAADWALDPAVPALALQAGDRVLLGSNEEEVESIEAEEIEVKLSWLEGDLIFRGESLAEAIDEIERYTTVEFVIMGEDLKKIRVAGLFKAGDVKGLLTTLKENFNIAYQQVGEEQIILTMH